VFEKLWWWAKDDLYNTDKFPGIDKTIHRDWRAVSPQTHILEILFARGPPKMMVELGVFRGGTTFILADLLREKGFASTFVVSIDSWLNDFCFSQSHLIDNATKKPAYYCNYESAMGGSLMFHNFVQGIYEKNHTSRVIPFPSSTTNAAATFYVHGWTPDAIFVDASHSFADLTLDLELWWGTLACGGVMYGDDYLLVGVTQAVNLFAYRRGIRKEHYHFGNNLKFWVFPPKKC
jgi:hypothetical protein